MSSRINCFVHLLHFVLFCTIPHNSFTLFHTSHQLLYTPHSPDTSPQTSPHPNTLTHSSTNIFLHPPKPLPSYFYLPFSRFSSTLRISPTSTHLSPSPSYPNTLPHTFLHIFLHSLHLPPHPHTSLHTSTNIFSHFLPHFNALLHTSPHIFFFFFKLDHVRCPLWAMA